MLIKINRSPFLRPIALFLILIFLVEIFYVPGSFALTSGPAQPEALSFKAAENQQLVDPFTGKFAYNIPILTVGDYPINLSYNSHVTMDQEASWVGLGWNMNIGQINRSMRGLPDDFNGDFVTKGFNMKENRTVGGLIGGDLEIAGLGKLKFLRLKGGYSIDLKYNNYTGLSLGQTLSGGLGAKTGAEGPGVKLMGTMALSSSGEGLNIQPNLSFSAMTETQDESVAGALSAGWGISVNSRSGLQQRTLSSSINTDVYAPLSYGSNKLFGPVTFTPQIQLPFTTKAISFSVKIGKKITIDEGSGKISGYFSKQQLTSNTASNAAYGFCFLEKGQLSSESLLDFNREKDAPFIPGSPNLPVTYLTPDIFQIGAQGIDGSFRAYRNNTGYVFDPKVTNGSTSSSQGYEVNIGNLFKAGVDITKAVITSTSSEWSENNSAIDKLKFQKPGKNDPVHNVYFKKIGDPANGINSPHSANSGGIWPVQFELSGGSKDLEIGCTDNYKSPHSTYPINENSKKSDSPLATANPFQCLSVKQVKMAGIDRKNYLNSSATRDHHIGRITVYKEDGKRYIFGLPAYNNLQKEVSFAVNGSPDNNRLVSYSANMENSTGNKSGLDNFYTSTSLPPFAYAWYLTDVLSPDYVDLTNNGPSADDYGNYVQFHSSKKIPGYKWRTPFHGNRAQFDEQLYSLTNDNKGHYIYGERDVWYVDSITSKTQVAVFHKSKREDAYEVSGENGGIGSNSLWRIDSISLYNVHDYYSLKAEAFPQVRVHFKYDYLLCTGVPNHKTAGGKLTLTELYFTYGSSFKGRYKGYKFSYDMNNNPGYSMVNTDRWGMYKPNDAALPNHLYPYSLQDKDLRDQHVSSWLLKKIELPSGGYIEVNYESDDYVYVQDKKAMRMYKVMGASDNSNPQAFSDLLYNNSFVFFDLEENSVTSEKAETAISKMIDKIASGDIYFKFKVNIDKNASTKDFVYGYCKKDPLGKNYGTKYLNGKWYGWLKLQEVPIDDKGSDLINPISRAAIQFCRLNTPLFAFDQVAPGNFDSDPIGALKDLLLNASIIDQILKFAEGPNGSLKAKGIGKSFEPGSSWIRFEIPGSKKLGGGARVKKLIFSNNWNIIQGTEPEHNREQEFFYEFAKGISSGVATYEPLLGADEIPHRQPVTYSDELNPPMPQWAKTLAPHDSYLKEEPFGEMAFPPAEIGYSRVTISNSVPLDLSSRGTGFTVYEFYTAKDFPVITRRTNITAERRKWKKKFTVFEKKMKDFMTVSQGYYIELNNMHGKPKWNGTYNASGGIINESRSEYFTPGTEIKVLKPNGKITLDTLGTEEDMVADFREQVTSTKANSNHANLGIFNLLVLVIIPLYYVSTDSELLRFRSATTTRIVYKYGILKKQTISDLGAKVETENLVFNPVTGSPILTKINNQYLDPVYSFSYPAESFYKGMASAGINLNTLCNISLGSTGQIISSNNFLTGGDELLDLTNGNIYWVRKFGSAKYLINSAGSLSGAMSQREMLVYRSGHRNLLGNSAGEITCLENPLINDGPNSWKIDINQGSKVLNASAATFDEGYNGRCFDLPDTQVCRLTKMAKALESLMNQMSASSTCFHPTFLSPFISALPNGHDIAWFNHLFPDNVIDLYHLWWKIDEAGPNFFTALIYLGDSSTVQSEKCRIKFKYTCPQITPKELKSILCNAEFSLETTKDCSRLIAELPCPLGENSLPVDSSTAYTSQGNFSLGQGTRSNYLINNCCSDSFTLYVDSACFTLAEPISIPGFECGTPDNTILNPYTNNTLGTWHPDKQYALISDRFPSPLATSINLRTDGYYESFSPFWKIVSNTLIADTNGWTRTNANTLTDPDGKILEARDALDRFSSTILGYNHQLPIGSAVNARYREIASENFEDYYQGFPYQIPQNNSCYHFKFQDDINNLVNGTAHTGHYSMKIMPGEDIFCERPISFMGCMPPPGSVSFKSSRCNCEGIFSPVAGLETKFIMSFWQKSANPPGAISTNPLQALPKPPIFENSLSGIIPEIKIDNVVIPHKLIYESEDIEGWIKKDYEFTVPPSEVSDTIRFSFINPNTSGNHVLFIDDLRIHPHKSSMKTFVYDPFTHRLMSTLDENNFAAIYQYDEEGNLQEIIHETERGRVYTQYFKKEQGLR